MLTINEIEKIANAKIINGKKDEQLKDFNISCTNHFNKEFYLPVSLHRDRHPYIIDAVKMGAKGFMISSSCENYETIIKESLSINSNLIILEVENVNDALYKMGEYNRQKHINIPVIAVTGSVGKTSTCEMIASILRQERKTFSDTRNNNTRLLLSLLLLDIDKYDIAVLEAGIASKNKMEPISKLLEPSIVVINNIGTAHIGNLGSKENILKEKLCLTNYMKDEKTVFLNDNDALLHNLQLDSKYNTAKYNIDEAFNINQENDILTFNTHVYGKLTHFSMHVFGYHNISNAICAIKIAELLHISVENIIKGLKEYKSVSRRFNVIEKNGLTIIDDTYNASLASMQAGLVSANTIPNCQRKIAVLGEMLELGDLSEELHSQVGKTFENLDFDILLTQGENTKYICETARQYIKTNEVINFENQDDLINKLLNIISKGDLIYLKASKKMQFDNIVSKLLSL
ncbi:MAG: UDP-N-acetylmuramoyl-tripeptide--D-alanyl-D-alanine ligase [Clostridia bacterium]|nr:UDP-N-acetylmuramoyl-tripeptide--D-alanyl-D-alanine ligase [Clostridia bacterium]